MGHLKIHCDNCGGDWLIYHRDNWKDWKARTCPICGESINKSTWEQSVLKAFGEMSDANLELAKDNAQYHGTLFTVSYEPDMIYPNKAEGTAELKEELEELREAVEGVKNVTARIIEAIFTE